MKKVDNKIVFAKFPYKNEKKDGKILNIIIILLIIILLIMLTIFSCYWNIYLYNKNLI